MFSRRQFLKWAATAVGGATLTGVGGYTYASQVELEWLAIEELAIPIKGLPPAAEGLRLVQLSDFHLYPFIQLPFIQKIVAAVADLNPDVVLLTGDYVAERADAIFDLAPVLAQLNPTWGMFATLGNHDYWTDSAVVRQGLHETGIPLLVNEGAVIGRDWLYIAGVDDCWAGQPDLEQALAHCPAHVPTVLLAHEPDTAEWWPDDGRVALQLSGHSHGGQIRAPGYGAIFLPYLGQKYGQGLAQVGQMQVYTTRGLGVVGVPLRFHCRPEITLITLTGA